MAEVPKTMGLQIFPEFGTKAANASSLPRELGPQGTGNTLHPGRLEDRPQRIRGRVQQTLRRGEGSLREEEGTAARPRRTYHEVVSVVQSPRDVGSPLRRARVRGTTQ